MESKEKAPAQLQHPVQFRTDPRTAKMIDGQLRGPGPSLAGGDDTLQIRQDRLVKRTLKTDARIVETGDSRDKP
jgi:hypothetical protein